LIYDEGEAGVNPAQSRYGMEELLSPITLIILYTLNSRVWKEMSNVHAIALFRECAIFYFLVRHTWRYCYEIGRLHEAYASGLPR
jgi:hypothetical protein